MTLLFQRCFAIVVNTEGGFTDNAADPGNWTGGRVNAGELRGTKWGISAAAYPHLDIAHLTVADAAALYEHDYWQPIGADSLAPAVALIAFDSAVNSGVSRARTWLQQTSTARHDQAAQAAAILALRIIFLAGLPTWRTFGNGWAQRLAALPFHAQTLGA